MDVIRTDATRQVGVANAPPRPIPPPVNFDEIPDALRKLPRWCLWRYELRRDESTGASHWTKIPYRANDRWAKTSDLSTWGQFKSARLFYTISRSNPNPYDGIGFLIAPDAGQIGVDLDSAIDPVTGQPWPWAQPIIDTLAPSYGELSPSGRGLKFIVAGEALPTQKTGGNFRPLPAAWNANEGAAVELYHRKFFTFTGNIFDGCKPELHDRGDYVHSLFRQLMLDREARRPKKHTTNGHTAGVLAPPATSADDQAILAKARSFKNGDQFTRLWAGDTSGHASHSQADAALCNALAFVVGPDENRIDQLFRQSGLYRDKWDREDYGPPTIKLALAGRGPDDFFTWKKPQRPKQAKATEPASAVEGSDENGVDAVSTLGNFEVEINEDCKPEKFPRPIGKIITAWRDAFDDWPRQADGALFVQAGADVNWLANPAALFGWASSEHGVIEWTKGTGYTTKEEFFAEIRRTATGYTAIETLPHLPPVPNHYYTCAAPSAGSGDALRAFLDRFSYATEIDRDLHLAAIATLFWGGGGGCRPAFVVTSDFGRGAGKTRLVELTAQLAGGSIDFSAKDDIAEIKCRLLNGEGLSKRVATLDNVKTLRFSWAELEALITAGGISGKRMYAGEGRRPNLLTWFVTLNGASLSTDVAQRCVIVKLARPKRSGDWEELTRKFVSENRDAILADVAAFFQSDPAPPKSFSRWASWEKDILSRLPEPNEAQRVILERQAEADTERDDHEHVEDFFVERLKELGYDVDTDRVFLPSEICCRWLGWATNEKHRTGAATAILKQAATEGVLRRIQTCGRSNGRGFIFLGHNASPNQNLWKDVPKRISDLMKKKNEPAVNF